MRPWQSRYSSKCVVGSRSGFLLRSLDTEIDWTAYMEQVAQVLQGERDYALIKGGTGPLWYKPLFWEQGIIFSYPAGHVWIYSGLYKFTGEGKDIFSAQIIFVALYLVTLAITFSLYLETKVSNSACTTNFRFRPIFFLCYVFQSASTVFMCFGYSMTAGHSYSFWQPVRYISNVNGLLAVFSTHSRYRSKWMLFCISLEYCASLLLLLVSNELLVLSVGYLRSRFNNSM